jgi:glucosamine-6-phosphate deaminase
MMVKLHLEKTGIDVGRAAAQRGADAIRRAIAARGEANIVVATGASQFEMLSELTAAEIDWSKVTAFHLDEYIGMSADHPASFRRYLRERFASRLPRLRAMHYINGDAPDLDGEISRLNRLISAVSLDVVFAGIGENAHLAFNDPPADFETVDPYIVVKLDARCRAQQLGEGWFASLGEVPERAISMSVNRILSAGSVILCVPDSRKAAAVRDTLEKEISPAVPASILRRHNDCHLFVDPASAALLRHMPDRGSE